MNTFDHADEEADNNTDTNINTNMTNSNSDSTTHEESSLLLSYCILWSPLHPITAFLPFIGHMGISDSQGRAHDFQGPFHVGTDQSYPVPKMAFGTPTRYLKLSDIQNSAHYDAAIQEADRVYAKRMHNICCDNCHSHVARALNIMNYQGRHNFFYIFMCLTGCVTPRTLVLFLAVSSFICYCCFCCSLQSMLYPYNSCNCFPNVEDFF